ncbi:hypothetical protein K0M31_010294, partial [Melipona bicolor]
SGTMSTWKLEFSDDGDGLEPCGCQAYVGEEAFTRLACVSWNAVAAAECDRNYNENNYAGASCSQISIIRTSPA